MRLQATHTHLSRLRFVAPIVILAFASNLLVAAPGAFAAAGTFDVGADISYTENAPAISALSDFTLSNGGQDYAGGSVTYSIAGTNESGETLGFSTVQNASNVNGAISVVGSTIFKGNGTTAGAIGNIDATVNGQGTQDLKVNFSNSFQNGDFSQGTTGWTVTNSRAELGYINTSGVIVPSTMTIGGFTPPVDTTFGPGTSGVFDRATAPNTYSSNTTSSNLYMQVNNGSCSAGYCVLRGPYVVSNAAVYLGTNDQVSFSWTANAGSDAFDVYGYLLNVDNGKAIKLIDETGRAGANSSGVVTATMGTTRDLTGYFATGTRRTDLKTRSVGTTTFTTGTSAYDDRYFTDGTSFTPGQYKFVFLAGSYDDSGGQALGATFIIDNVSVSSASGSSGVTSADIQTLSRLLTYSNTSGLNATRTLGFSSSLGDTSTAAAQDKIISVTAVNDAPVVSAISGPTYTDTVAVDTFTNNTGTVSATDEENATLTYSITGGTLSGGSYTKTGAFGSLSLNSSTGAYTYTPNAAVINDLDSNRSETFVISVSDGVNSVTTNYVVSVNAVVDNLPKPPTIVSVTAVDGSFLVTFNPPVSSGTSSVTNYRYSTDGVNFRAFSPAQSSSPLSIATLSSNGTTALSFGVSYSITIQAVNASGNSGASNSVTAILGPQNTSVPVLSTSGPVNADLLTTTDGVWNDNGHAVSATTYQWQRYIGGTWVTISGATSSSYTVTSSDVGYALRSVVTKTNADGVTTVYSAGSSAVLPLPPSDPTITAVTSGNGQLVVTFQAPSTNGGGTITGYHYSLNGGTTWVTNATISAPTFTVTGLTNGNSYEVMLRAVNAGGFGVASASVTEVPYTSPSNSVVPSFAGVAVNAQVLTAVDGSWASNGRSISATSYQWQRNTGSGWVNISSATSSTYTLSDADVLATVRVAVTKTNLAGSVTEYSLASSAVSALPPFAPTVTAVTASDGQFTVSFTAPSYNGGSLVTGYHYSLDGGSTWVTNVSIASSPFTVSGLTNGTMYTVAVRAINAAGNSAASVNSSHTPFGLPINSAVSTLSQTPRVGEGLTFSSGTWSNNGSVITAQTQQWQRRSSAGWVNISSQTGATYVVTSADVGSQLRVAVFKTNAAGTSVSYSLTSPVVTVTPPDAPALSSGQSGINQLTFTAGFGLLDGGATAMLEYTLNGIDWIAFTPNNAGQFTVQNLTGGTRYIVQIRATNTAGSTLAQTVLEITPSSPAVVPVTNTPVATKGIAPAEQVPVVIPKPALTYGDLLPVELKKIISAPVLITPETVKALTSTTGATKAIVIDENGRPELKPLQTLAMVDGASIPTTLSINTEQTGFVVSGDGFNVAVSSQIDGTASDAQLQLIPGKTVYLEVVGFAPGQPIYLWMFSSPTDLGYVMADRNGNFSGEVAVPEQLQVGEHTFQVNGVSAAGEVRSVSLGVNVAEEAATAFEFLWWVLLIVFIVALAVYVSIRRRQKA